MKIALQTMGLLDWFDGDIHPVIEIVRRADELGVYQVELPDHIVMGHDISNYPFGKPRTKPPYPWYEPISVMSALAMVTRHIRLSTGIIIAPLRPPALFAKQLSTLDHLSRGRVDIGVGVGWQKLEFDACGIDWPRRFERLAEQIRICQALWTRAPVDFAGEFYRFEDAHCLPYPVQPGGVPVWFGLPKLSERTVGHIAELGAGWIPGSRDPQVLAEAVATLKEAISARGRDASQFQVRVGLGPAPGEDPLRALDRIPDYAAAGVTVLSINAKEYAEDAAGLERVLEAAVEAADAAG